MVSFKKNYQKNVLCFFFVLESRFILFCEKIHRISAQKSSSFSEWAVLHRKMSRSARQNGPF